MSDDVEYPVVLQNRAAPRQAAMFGVFALFLVAIPIVAFATGFGGRYWLLLLALLALLPGYFALRLLTLRVILDDQGLHEPQLFRPTIVTAWEDVVRVRRHERDGALGLKFLFVGIEHQQGWKHQVVALNITSRDPLADATLTQWIEAIRAAKSHFAPA